MIKVKVVKDRDFDVDMTKELQKAFLEFKRQFGVDFEISGISEWNLGRIPIFHLLDALPFRKKLLNTLFNYLMGNLRRVVSAGENEIVVGFTGRIGSQHKKTFGLADGNYVLIGLCKKPYSYVILHEVGHVFGAEDRPDLSIMSSRLFCCTYDFSARDREIIARSLVRFRKE